MRGFLYPVLAFIVVVLAALLANSLMEDNGYVLIQYLGRTLESSVPGFIVLLVGLYIAVRLLVHLVQSGPGLFRATRKIREREARKRMARGLMDISEGNYARAERMLARSAHLSETPVLNYLGAAQAAQQQGATERRDNWLMLAYEDDSARTDAVLLTQVELQMADKQYEQALATINRLEQSAPGQPRATRLLADIYRELADWDSLAALLPRLKKQKSMPPAELDALSRTVHGERLAAAERLGDAQELEARWMSVPKPMRTDPELLEAYVSGLAATGAHGQAEAIVRKALKKTWSDALVDLYGRLDTGTPQQLLTRAEGWLNTRGDDPVLLLAAARLSMACELWGKARSYLESSLGIRPTADAYRVYGDLLERLGEHAPAIDAFRAGLALATGAPATAPAVTGPTAPNPALEAD